MRTSTVRPPRPARVVAAAVLLVLGVACQGADGGAEVSSGEAVDVEGDGTGEPDGASGDDPSPEVREDDQDAGSVPRRDGSGVDDRTGADEGNGTNDGVGAREALEFSARSLDGDEVEVAEVADGPTMLWMWAPW